MLAGRVGGSLARLSRGGFGDNLTVAPNGHLIVCEDRTGSKVNHLRGVTPEGQTYTLARLNAEQIQARTNALRGFVLGGAELEGEAKERFAAIQERQAELSQKFSENALDATDAYAYYATAEELDGIPDDVQQAALAAAQADGKEGYKLTLKMPCYLPVMQFAARSDLREKFYRAYVTRASDQAEGDARKFDNTALISEILALRREEAQLLGYANFGEVSVVH